MAFFPPDPEMPEFDHVPHKQPWWGPPNDELPTITGTPEVLASTDYVAVGLAGIRVYRDGIEILLERRLRRGGADYVKWQELVATFLEHGFPGGRMGEGRLRYGVQLEDGTRATDSLFHSMTDPNSPPADPVLVRSGGGGGGDNVFYSSSDSLWLYPRPRGEALDLIMQWPALDIPEVGRTLNIDGIDELSERSQPFWP